jgi:hypothetical protein
MPLTGWQLGIIPSGGGSGQFQVFNVLNYGATGNGTTDDTTAIQSAINACQTAGGGVVFFPPGTYKITAGLTISADNIQIVGSGWSSQILASGAISGYMLTVNAPGGGAFRYGILIADIFFNGASIAALNGLDIQTTYSAKIDHVRIRFVFGIAIHMDGSSGNTGAYNSIIACHITDGGAGVGVQTDFSEWLTIFGGLFSFYNSAGGIAVRIQNLNCRLIGVGIDNNDTGVRLEFAGRCTIIGCQFDRGQTQFIYMHGTQYCTVVGNSFNTFNGVASGQGAINVTDTNNAGNIITSNTLKGGSTWPNFILEHGTVGTPANLYEANDVGAAPVVLISGIARDNIGLNPVGSVTPPAFPGTTVAQVNNSGYDIVAYIANGTSAITVIQIAGVGGTYVTTGMQIAASGWAAIPLKAGEGIKFTYAAGTPTWTWMAD